MEWSDVLSRTEPVIEYRDSDAVAVATLFANTMAGDSPTPTTGQVFARHVRLVRGVRRADGSREWYYEFE
jgi:hypothetical protein